MYQRTATHGARVHSQHARSECCGQHGAVVGSTATTTAVCCAPLAGSPAEAEVEREEGTPDRPDHRDRTGQRWDSLRRDPTQARPERPPTGNSPN